MLSSLLISDLVDPSDQAPAHALAGGLVSIAR
jgi:hypothetical protein